MASSRRQWLELHDVPARIFRQRCAVASVGHHVDLIRRSHLIYLCVQELPQDLFRPRKLALASVNVCQFVHECPTKGGITSISCPVCRKVARENWLEVSPPTALPIQVDEPHFAPTTQEAVERFRLVLFASLGMR